MILSLAGGLDHLLDDMRRCRLIGIAHPKINNVVPALPRLKLKGLNLREDVRRESLDPIKTFAQPHELPLNVFRYFPSRLITINERRDRKARILMEGFGLVNLPHFYAALKSPRRGPFHPSPWSMATRSCPVSFLSATNMD
jgi:hypothetical protein